MTIDCFTIVVDNDTYFIQTPSETNAQAIPYWIFKKDILLTTIFKLNNGEWNAKNNSAFEKSSIDKMVTAIKEYEE